MMEKGGHTGSPRARVLRASPAFQCRAWSTRLRQQGASKAGSSERVREGRPSPSLGAQEAAAGGQQEAGRTGWLALNGQGQPRMRSLRTGVRLQQQPRPRPSHPDSGSASWVSGPGPGPQVKTTERHQPRALAQESSSGSASDQAQALDLVCPPGAELQNFQLCCFSSWEVGPGKGKRLTLTAWL